MVRFTCFSTLLVGKKKKSKESPKSVDTKKPNMNETPKVKPEELFFEALKSPTSNPVIPSTDMAADVAADVAYEGGDEQDNATPMKRDFSDLDLHAQAETDRSNSHHSINSIDPIKQADATPGTPIASGHISDPGMVCQNPDPLEPSPKLLKRSCSNIETKRSLHSDPSSPVKSRSHNDLSNLPSLAKDEIIAPISPLSVKTSCSADRVMLKKHSSSQVLPSRSRKLWWRLFLWSHRNLHRPVSVVSCSARPERRGSIGYTSDTLDTGQVATANRKSKKKDKAVGPANQWVAFSAEASSLDRVNAWVNSIPNGNDSESGEEGEMEEVFYPNSPEIGESSGKGAHAQQAKRRAAGDEFVQANNIVQSLNTMSSVAHISGMGLKVVPAIAAFTSLRAVNLSGNFIVHITAGALPKSLHTLDLSRNKIGAIEGLRELTRLRVLNLSYNRILRIGQGLSNCTAIKELYLAGNKISDVDGLHRLLKLTVLDLSFNKITLAKALGQLVANYNSLLALNLLGNPIQSNIGDDQLRKSVSGLLPRLAYLNKQQIKPQRGREAATDSITKAALGNGGWGGSSRRKLARRLSQNSGSGSGSVSIRSRVAEGSSSRSARNHHRSQSRHKK